MDLSREVSLVGLAFHLVVLCLELVCLVEVCPVEFFPSEGEVSSEEPHPRSLRSRPNPFSLFSVVLVGVCLVPGVPGLAVTSLAEEVLYSVDRLLGDSVVSVVLTPRHHPVSGRLPWLASWPLSASFVSPCLSRHQTQFFIRWHYSDVACSSVFCDYIEYQSMEWNQAMIKM